MSKSKKEKLIKEVEHLEELLKKYGWNIYELPCVVMRLKWLVYHG